MNKFCERNFRGIFLLFVAYFSQEGNSKEAKTINEMYARIMDLSQLSKRVSYLISYIYLHTPIPRHCTSPSLIKLSRKLYNCR